MQLQKILLRMQTKILKLKLKLHLDGNNDQNIIGEMAGVKPKEEDITEYPIKTVESVYKLCIKQNQTVPYENNEIATENTN